MEVYIVTKSEMHSDSIVGVYESKEDAQKYAERIDNVDDDANYYVESHVVIGASDRTERMKLEKAELEQRITKLLAFMESDKFAELDATEKRLLRMQYSGIETYLTSLSARLLREDIKRYEGDIKALSAECAELQKQGKSEEDIAAIMKDKMSAIANVGSGMLDSVTQIALSGMVFGAMQK